MWKLFKNNIIKFDETAIKKIIEEYTSEAGVRELERCINKIIRKVITEHLKSSRKLVSVRINESDLSHYLEKEQFLNVTKREIKHTGVIKCVACSKLGGCILEIECSSFKGSGKFTYTGALGDIAKESIEVAISYIKSNAKKFNINENFFEENDLHIHFTKSSISKDGPSAGIAIITAILSLIKNKIISCEISMTGEITLKGDILKVGGLKEKITAAKRNKITTIYIPEDNKNDIEWISNDLKVGINIKTVSNYEEIYNDLFS